MNPASSSLCFSSVHLHAKRQTSASRERWMEEVNSMLETKEQESGKGSRGEMNGSPERLRQNDRWGDYGTRLLSTVIKVREPPCTTKVDSQPITPVDRVKIQRRGNTLHFNIIFVLTGQNSLSSTSSLQSNASIVFYISCRGCRELWVGSLFSFKRQFVSMSEFTLKTLRSL